MRLQTSLPLATLFFKHWGPDDREQGIVIAQAVFRRATDGRFYADLTPPELRLVDSFASDPACSALTGEQDIAPDKAATDLIVHAIARSPEGRAMADWPVTLTLPGRLRLEFRVRGPVLWQRRGPGLWRQDAPQPVTEVPLDYALAYGGCLRDAEGLITDHHPENPAGRGFVTRDWLAARQEPFAAPQIGLLPELMQADPLAPMMVTGLGPVAKTWAPRRALAGTFDAAWQRDRQPRMPADYDLRFWNAAARPLQFYPFLTGTEVFALEGLSASGPIALPLPGVALGLQAQGPGGMSEEARLTLDTVEADLRSPDPAAHQLRLTWRLALAQPERFQTAVLVSLPPLSEGAPA